MFLIDIFAKLLMTPIGVAFSFGFGFGYIVWMMTSRSNSGPSTQSQVSLDSRESPKPDISTPVILPFNKEAVRIRVEDFFFQKKISKDAMDELLVLLKIKEPSVSTAPLSAQTHELRAAPPPTASIGEAPNPAMLDALIKSDPKYSPPVSTSSGFFNSQNIKIMLISGCTLFVLSAYLFVRSYWNWIPDILKFLVLVGVTFSVFVLGKQLLGKTHTPKTSESLLGLFALLIPFNFFAANVLVFNHAVSSYTSWAMGAFGMFVTAAFLTQLVSTWSIGVIWSAGILGTFLCGGLARDLSSSHLNLCLSVGILINLITAHFFNVEDEVKRGILGAGNIFCLFMGFGFLIHGFFIQSNEQLAIAGCLFILGIVFTIQSRTDNTLFAYPAGLCMMGCGVLLLHYYQWPVYKYGLYFVPAGLLSTLRGWSFHRAGREDLGAPYFHLGQLAVAGSIISIFPYFRFYIVSGFSTLITIMLFAALAYALLAVLYKNPIFTYAVGLILLLGTWTSLWHYELPFSLGILIFGMMASIFVVGGMVMRSTSNQLVGQPFSVIGLGTVSISIALLAGRWGWALAEGGSISSGLPSDQITSGILVGSMCAGAYILSAILRKQPALIFPTFISATLVYLFSLEKWGVPINLYTTSWIVVVSLFLYYLSHSIKWETASRSFAVWADLVFMIIAAGTLASPSTVSLKAISLCACAFFPSLILGRLDLVAFFLMGLYIAHLTWFKNRFGNLNESLLFSYAFQLLLVNSFVVLVRTLIAARKPKLNFWPYRFFVGLFTIISLLAALSDKSNAWQIYLACGVLALVVSYVNYEGRYLTIGTSLLLISYELFLWAHNVQLTEAYSVPAGLYCLNSGYLLKKSNKELMNVLYVVAQIVLYLPSFSKAIAETWEFHGVFLGVLSLSLMLFGIHQRNKILTLGSLFVMLLNGVVQSFQFLTAVPRWIYLGLGGATLVSLGGFFEFQRDLLIQMRKTIVSSLEHWD